MRNSLIKKQTGFSLVEVLIAVSIMSLTVFSLISASTKGLQLSQQSLAQIQTSYLLEEGAEAVKSIRDTAWTNIGSLTTDTAYYLAFNTGTNTWSLSTTPTSLIDSVFTRTVVFSSVTRDINDDIVSSNDSYDDPGTRGVTVTVSRILPSGTVSKTLSFYMSNIFN